VVLGLLAVVAIPAAIAASEQVKSVELLHAASAVPVAGVVGLAAIGLARRARQQVQLTLGRVGGARVAWTGRTLGLLGVYLAVTAALAVGFYGLLELFASD